MVAGRVLLTTGRIAARCPACDRINLLRTRRARFSVRCACNSVFDVEVRRER